jgi:transcriptional regulator GlxA family with amidase domain
MCALHSPGPKYSSNSFSSNGASAAPDKHQSSRARNGKPAATDLVGHQGRVLKILEMIQSEPLCRIHDLARAFNLSNSYLEHLFKKQTGVPLGQLLTEQRLRRAACLLAQTNLRIKEIAQAVGYEHTSSFVRAFERYFAKAPRLYRHEATKPARDQAKLRAG